MAQLAIKGHRTQGVEVIKLLETLGGKNNNHHFGYNDSWVYYIDKEGYITLDFDVSRFSVFTLEEFLEKFPYKVGDKVRTVYGRIGIINQPIWSDRDNCIRYELEADTDSFYSVNELQPYKEETMEDKGNISDGYHTFNELYEYRLLYNASMFNELAKQGLYDVHKSKLHSDGTISFGDENWFIVQAELPTGQISNHYEIKDWNLFQVPVKEKANPYDGHSPQDVANRLREFLTPKPKYPNTYEECCKVLLLNPEKATYSVCGLEYKRHLIVNFQRLIICRDAYWKVAGNWKPNFENYDEKFVIAYYYGKIHASVATNYNRVLAFPTKEMHDVFYENFKELIEGCKELL